MKLTKKNKAEITQFLQKYWDTYFEGNLSQWQTFITDDYKNIGTNQEEIWNNKSEILDYTNRVLDQMIGKAEVRNKKVQIFPYDPYIMTHELGDLYVKAEEEWNYYAPFRLSTLLQKNEDSWIVLHQHGSFPDSKTEEGEAFAFDSLKSENKKLQKAVKDRTIELEKKNRELEVETALERIRAQAVAMKQSSDLLDIVVTIRNEFTKLGHEAHYFWHMMWLPETYEKAMTSGDGSKIGFVMELPRHMHGDIPLLAKWEKSKKPTVVYAMNVDEAIDYVDKMVALGNFKNIDPQAPTHDDIKHIGGLTFIMARTTHGEIGYSLPGVVKNPPKKDIDLLEKFAGAFDLAHRRFLDLQKAEAQARETQIELALEKVRSRTMAMQHSDELAATSLLLFEQFKNLGDMSDQISIGIINEEDNLMELYSTIQGKQWKDVAKVDLNEPVAMKRIHADWKKKRKSLVIDLKEDELKKYNSYRKKLSNLSYEEKRWVIHVAFFSNGVLTFSSTEPFPSETILLLERFASVFDGTYQRFLDLKKAEAQAREAQIEAALERVRSKSMAMHNSEELREVVNTLYGEFQNLQTDFNVAVIQILDDTKDLHLWVSTSDGLYDNIIHWPFTDMRHFNEMYKAWTEQTPLAITLSKTETQEFFEAYFQIETVPKERKRAVKSVEQMEIMGFYQKHTGIFLMRYSEGNYSDEEREITQRFSKVFEQTYIRFLDLKKAEAQAREAQIEAALERVRSKSMAMHNSEELKEVIQVLYDQFIELNIKIEHAGFILDYKKNDDMHIWLADHNAVFPKIVLPYFDSAHWNDFVDAKKTGRKFFANQLDFNEKNKFYKDLFKHIPDLPEETKATYFDFEALAISTVLLDNVGLYIENYKGIPFSEEENDILMRFGTVFQQSYTRFLDLQKAEAQARESRIQLALERVRARTMAMQSSAELLETSELLFQQIKELGIDVWSCGYSLWYDDDSYFIGYNPMPNGKMGETFKIPLTEDIFFKTIRKGKREGKDFLVFESKGKSLVKTYDYMDKLPVVGEGMRAIVASGFELPKFQVTHCGYFSHGHLMFITLQHYPEAHDIFKRFTKEFEQTYTRFLDLQKAEAQAREAQIEVAVERVRAEAMAMHATTDFEKVTRQLLKQVQHLKLDGFTGASILSIDENDVFSWWDFSSPGNISDPKNIHIKYEAHKYKLLGKEVLKKWKEGNNYMVFEYDLKRLNMAVKEWEEIHPALAEDFKKAITEGNFTHQWNPCGRLANGLLAFDMVKPPDEDVKNIVIKMAHAFEQAYIRFMDLQKAEAQAREAQIETALEKVRSRTMAMQRSEELPEAANVLFTEVQHLGIPAWSCGYNILSEDKKSSTCIMSSEGEIQSPFILPLTEHISLKPWHKAILNNQQFFVYEQGGKELEEHYNYMQSLPELKDTFQQLKDADISLPTFQVNHLAKFTNGFLLFITYERVPEAQEIFQRFAKVFEQTYTRFLDLKKVEAQAREAQIEASLEKVRSRSLAMQNTNELKDVVVVIVEKLTELGVILDANGVTLCTYFPDSKDVMHWIASPDFSHVGKYLLPYFDHVIFRDAWESKEQKDAYFSKAYSVKEKNSFFEHAFEHSDYKHFPEEIKEWIFNNDKHTLSFAWQKNSAILIPSNTGVLPTEDEKEILIRFSKVFEQAYIRFMDLQKAEIQSNLIKKEKERLEITLSELRATQSQLIQSEKMASLGELTAGIAHEIQNPLNFVNNFSEVSKELLDEMLEEIENGDLEEVKALMVDVVQNLEKINHHGKRADGIVKGMLQHSRSSGNKKESTNINALTDEYFRLAYHGLRAKDKSFNATLETDYDDSIGNIMVIPQDMGRVILNLITNAFYAVNEKLSLSKTSGDKKYEPTVYVSTKHNSSSEEGKGLVTITVKDNGNGIPQNVLDKIFQPFFTTKPTGQGTGLGLSMSYDIVTKGHGGELKVETKEGKGTTFKIELKN